MDFANDADLLKAIMKKGNEGGDDDMNVDDELEALEAEVNGPKKKDKKKKKDNDDLSLSDISDDSKEEKKEKDKKEDEDLKKLEEEGLDDVDSEEENTNKNKKAPQQKTEPPKKTNPQPAKPQINKDELKAAMQKQKPTAAPAKGSEKSSIEDLYPEKTEEKYHNIQKMNSLGTLKEESEMCDKIIEIKKKLNLDYDTWEIKKESIEQRTTYITSTIQNGIWDFDVYKKKIQEQSNWESKLLFFLTKDPSLSPRQKEELKRRVEKRIEIIKQELEQQIEEEDDEEEEKKEEEKTEEKKEEEKTENKNEEKKEEEKKEEKKEEEKPEPKDEASEKKQQLQKKNTHVIAVPKEKEEEECKRLNQIVTDRLNEYRAALDYFKKNDLTDQQVKCINSAKNICRELKKIQDGNWKEVDEFSLPDPITPEFIYGYSTEERKQKFTKIITEIFNQKKEVSDEMNKKINAFKRMSKVKFQKIENQAKGDLDKLKSKKEKFEKILAVLKSSFQDKWVPAPLYVENQEEIKVEKTNNDIPENTLRMIIGKTNYKKNNLTVIIKILDTKVDEVKYEQKAPSDFSNSIDFKLEKAEFKGLFKKRVRLELYEKKFPLIKKKYKAHLEIEPKPLKDHIEYKDTFKLELESQRKGQTVEIEFKVRNACHTPEYEITTKNVFSITKLYSSFKNKNAESITLDTSDVPKVTADDLKVQAGVPKAQQPKPVAKKPIAQKPVAQKQNNVANPKPQAAKATAAQGPPIDKSKFSSEELKDPDCIDALNTLGVLEFKHKKYEAIRDKIEGRTPRELMQKIIRIKCKINVLNDSLGDSIGPEDYLTLLKNTFAHDKLLAEYFAQQNDEEKGKLVRERLPLIVKETQDLKSQMGLK